MLNGYCRTKCASCGFNFKPLASIHRASASDRQAETSATSIIHFYPLCYIQLSGGHGRTRGQIARNGCCTAKRCPVSVFDGVKHPFLEVENEKSSTCSTSLKHVYFTKNTEFVVGKTSFARIRTHTTERRKSISQRVCSFLTLYLSALLFQTRVIKSAKIVFSKICCSV